MYMVYVLNLKRREFEIEIKVTLTTGIMIIVFD